jgi:hypothetical protein
MFWRKAIAVANKTAAEAAVIVTSSDKVALLSAPLAKKIIELPTATQTSNPRSSMRGRNVNMTRIASPSQSDHLWGYFFRAYGIVLHSKGINYDNLNFIVIEMIGSTVVAKLPRGFFRRYEVARPKKRSFAQDYGQ